ncbi:ABC transporter permease [Photobacterium lipolyticum]|uniref:ABC transporter permease n=1 Tax=Photobacterium lipolyticum TaxID=266810 RepID=A0A2T3N0R1_9GAMM|nr:ABC transporter permease [Photobacterium lipolyticum]PSW05793.1 ABC transporter permease [Photobacterium lipolyticum]
MKIKPVTMNPITRERWSRFRAHKRGYWSLWIFAVLFVICLFAEVVANDKPLVINFKSDWYFPIVQQYAETDFGGEFEAEADFTDPYVVELIEADGYMIWPLIPFHYDTINYNLSGPAPSPPDRVNWLGTDDKGRDVLARIIYGFRVSVLFGFALTIISTLIGVAVGACQGYYGGWLDLFGQRFIEVWSGMPTLFLLIILSSFVEPNFWWLLSIMVLFSWMTLVGVVRAEFLRCRNLDYVRAAQALGVSDSRIMLRHMLPNAMVASLTMMPFILSGSVTTLTSLDFLGFGLPAGSPSLGELLAQGKTNLQAPWLGLSAFVVLSIMLSLLVFVGEAVRDAFDPHHQK